MPSEDQFSVFGMCPGKLITALLMAAETVLFSFSADLGKKYATEAVKFIDFLAKQEDGSDYRALLSNWPVEIAMERFHTQLAKPTRVLTVDIVIARCHWGLGWMKDIFLTTSTRVLVYDKCANTDFDEQVAGWRHRVAETVDVKVPKDGEFMTAECTAYSQHQPPQPRDRVWTHWKAGETASQGDKERNSASATWSSVVIVSDNFCCPNRIGETEARNRFWG